MAAGRTHLLFSTPLAAVMWHLTGHRPSTLSLCPIRALRCLACMPGEVLATTAWQGHCRSNQPCLRVAAGVQLGHHNSELLNAQAAGQLRMLPRLARAAA